MHKMMIFNHKDHKKMKILIDNGHGCNTPGKRSPDGRFREYAWAREIARAVVADINDLGSGAPKVFLKYFYVNSATGETSVPMQALAKWAAAAAPAEPEGGEGGGD